MLGQRPAVDGLQEVLQWHSLAVHPAQEQSVDLNRFML